MAVPDNPVSSKPVPKGETPADGETRVYSGSVVKYDSSNRAVLTDRLVPGDYQVYNQEKYGEGIGDGTGV